MFVALQVNTADRAGESRVDPGLVESTGVSDRASVPTVIGSLVWVLASDFGPIGAAYGYLAVVALFVLPYQTFVWQRCRTERAELTSEAADDPAPA